MIHGIGVDLLRIERGVALWERHGARVADKLLHPQERRVFDALPDRAKGRAIARAWTAKEAFVKALGTGFRGIDFDEVGAVREDDAPPRLVFSSRLQLKLDALGIVASHLSFSDDDGRISAFVVLERA